MPRTRKGAARLNSYKPVGEHIADARACLERAQSAAEEKFAEQPGKWSRVVRLLSVSMTTMSALAANCPEE